MTMDLPAASPPAHPDSGKGSPSASSLLPGRDPLADADDSLIRKRPRLSQEQDTPPDGSNDSCTLPASLGDSSRSPVVIELVEEQPMDSSEVAIIMPGDGTYTHYKSVTSFPFINARYNTPEAAAKAVAGLFCDKKGSVPDNVFIDLSHWLHDHLNATDHEFIATLEDGTSPSAREFCRVYSDNVTFWNYVVESYNGLACRRKLNNETELKGSMAFSVFGQFFLGFVRLGERLLHTDVSMLAQSNARRDSTQLTDSAAQSLLFRSWPVLYNKLLVDQEATIKPLALVHHFNGGSIWTTAMLRFQNCALDAIVKLLKHIVERPETIQSPFSAAHPYLMLCRDVLVSVADTDYDRLQDLYKKSIDVLESTRTIIVHILPKIRLDDTAQRLSDQFAAAFVTIIQVLIAKGYISPSSAFDLVLREVADYQFDPTDLVATSAHNTVNAEDIEYELDLEGPLTQQIQVACTMGCELEYHNALIRSSSMELRVRGLDKLRTLTLEIWTQYSPAMKEYAARFLNAKSVVSYLCGPQSHTAMISKSTGAVGFLFAMRRLAKTDADALWNAFTNVQRPDMAHGTFGLLLPLVPYMHAPERMYFCEKYTSLPPSQFNRGVESLFGELMCRPIESSTSSPLNSFEAAFICINLLEKIGGSEMTVATQDAQLSRVGRTLAMLPSSDRAAEQFMLVKYCAGFIRAHTKSATGCVQALVCMLGQQSNPLITSEEITSLLSFQDCVEEFQLFVEQAKTSEQGFSSTGLSCRIGLALYVLSLSSSDTTIASEKDFWSYLVGRDSISPIARDIAWVSLVSNFQTLGSRIKDFYERCISQYLPALSPEWVVVNTHDVFVLEGHIQAADPQALIPLGEQCLRFAISCPCDQVSARFVDMLIEHLFKGKALLNPTLAVEKQLDLVKFCIAQLSSQDFSSIRAARLLRDLLSRSIVFEKSMNSQSKEVPDSVKESGPETIQIPIRVHKGKSHPQSRTVTVDKTAKCSDLEAAINSTTGFARYTAISAGQKIDLAAEPEQCISDLGINHGSTLIVQKHNTLESIQDELQNDKGATAVMKELLGSLDTLYDYLDGSDPATTEQIFQILCQLRFPGPIGPLVASSETSSDDLFPPSNPFRVRLIVEVLAFQLREQITVGVADEKFLSRGVRLLIDLLGRSECLPNVFVVYRATEVLLELLRERPINDEPEAYFKDPAIFVNQNFELLGSLLTEEHQNVGTAEDNFYRGPAIKCLYACILEGVLLSPAVGVAFASAPDVATLHLGLFMTNNSHLMTTIPAIVRNAMSNHNMPAGFKSSICSIFVNHLIPAAQTQPRVCNTVYSVAADVLLSDQNLANNEDSLRTLLASFSSALLSVEHLESHRNGFEDYRVQGLTDLLCGCIQSLRSLKKPVNADHLASKLFTKFLFPTSMAGDDGAPLTPIVKENARKKIYDVVRLLCDNSQTVEEMTNLCDEACKIANVPVDFNYSGPEDIIRSEQAYSGLVNLSQTCYMNSLIQQLFMNMRLRKFIFDTAIVNPKKQVILHEFKAAFARMQDSHGISYHPEALAKALDVDVTVQDDAHIFFTTLIGKLEESMPDEESKKVLRSFFGGSNRSQIVASCGHVSESSDKYFNLSLVVKDKASLSESLEEYVHGAALEGGDKFKCTTCGSGEGTYVDATRRTALDEVPDNLVLGLKRFRYESYDGGAKVNDRFDFPERIDMGPYKLNRLVGVDGHDEPDIFQLVGVVVHQGTLQFGHYWSYAAERGGTGAGPLPWYRFEDEKVVRTTIEEVLRETCGGPIASSTPLLRDQSPVLRSDNAYVLFYERVSSVDESASITASDPTAVAPSVHTRVDLPHNLANEIQKDNEHMIHILNLFSTDHLDFVRGLASKLGDAREEDSAKKNIVETRILHMLYRYFFHVVSCSSFTEIIDSTAQMLRKLACSNTDHAQWLLQSMLSHVKDNLVLHRKQVVRQATNRLVLACLAFLREVAPVEYGLYEYNGGVTLHTIVERVVGGLAKMLDALPECRNAIWQDYFSLLSQVAELGMHETRLLLDEDILQWCMEVILMVDFGELKHNHPGLWYEMSNGRRFNYLALIDCIYSLLHIYVDLYAGPVGGRAFGAGRRTETDMLMLTFAETKLLRSYHPTTGANCIAELCLSLARPIAVPWNEWSGCKLIMLLNDADRTPEDIVESAYIALQANLEYASINNNVGSITAACLIGGKMEFRACEGLIQVMMEILARGKITESPEVASAILLVVTTVYESRPALILGHVAQMATHLLVCDTISVEDNTAQWLLEQIFDEDMVLKPLTPLLMANLHQRVTVANNLLESLGGQLEYPAREQQDSRGYCAAIATFNNCNKFLGQAAAATQAELERQMNEQQDQGQETGPDPVVISTLLDDLQSIKEAIDAGKPHKDMMDHWVKRNGSRLSLRPSRDIVEEVSDQEASALNSDAEMSDYEEE